MNQPVILSYGKGVDSTAILLRWLREPWTRDFDLADLIVLTSQVGDEWADTEYLVELHILPLLKAAGVRFVEVARASKRTTDIAILQDSRTPEYLNPAPYSLSDELLANGTIPQSGGVHLCSIKSKAEPLERWIADNVSGTYRHTMGFNAGETKRVVKDVEARAKRGTLAADYRIVFGFNSGEQRRVDKAISVRSEKGQVQADFPLLDWGWDYAACQDYIALELGGVAWPKSACSFCPFARAGVIERFRAEPEAAAKALLIEHNALALNARMKLYKSKTLRELLEADGNTDALRAFETVLDAETWAVYRIRRIYSGPGKAVRKVEILDTGTRTEAFDALFEYGNVKEADGVYRVVVLDEAKYEETGVRVKKIKRITSAGTREETIAIAPARIEAKSGSKTFETKWEGA